MNRSLFLTCAAVAIAAVAVSAELRIGVVDSERVISEYKATKTASDAFDKEKVKFEQEATDRQAKIRGLQEQLDKQALLLSDERKKELTAQAQQLYVEYQQFLQKASPGGELERKQEELLKPIIEKANVMISRIAKDKNYDFVLEAKACIYVKPNVSYDLTDEVVAKLNSGDIVPATPAAPAK